MKNTSTKLMMMTVLMIGVIISVSSNSWLGIWLGLEINLLSFIPIMSSAENIVTTEASMKYFIVQAMASSILIFAIMSLSMTPPSLINQPMKEIMINTPLLVKMGSAPFHWWFPSVMEGLMWSNCLILLTIQKIAPLTLISYTMTLNMMSMMIIATSVTVGAIGGFNQTSLRKILTYSSINHVGWMISATIMSKPLMTMYLVIYSTMNWIIVSMMMKLNISHLNQINNMDRAATTTKILLITSILSLGGLPPFIGFMPKWIIILSLINNHMFVMTTLMVLMSLITLFYYLRITYSTFMLNDTKVKWINKTLTPIHKLQEFTTLTLISTGMIILTPGLMSFL
nr:NADH dehydrogenase subunit 2 [Anaplecta sp. 4 ZQW-2020]